MASNDNDIDDLDFDDGDDIPDIEDDLDIDGTDTGDRKPSEKVKTGFLKGVKSTASDSSFQKQLVDKTLPDGYGKAFGDVQDTMRLGSDLYDAAAKELAPAKKSFKSIGRKIAGYTEGKIPEGLQKKLEELSAKEESSRKIDRDQLEIDETLGGIFGEIEKSRAEQEAAKSEEENTEKAQSEALANVRHKNEIQQLDLIRQAQDRLVAYQDSVTARYQRKSLEYQIKQYHLSRDQLELLNASTKETKTQLDAVVENTALPDYIKMQTSEFITQSLREQVVASMHDRMRSTMNNMRDRVIDKVKGVGRSLAEGATSTAEGMEMAEDMEIDGTETAGQAAGSMGLEAGANWVGRKSRDAISRIPGVERFGNNLEYYSDNRNDIMRETVNNMGVDELDLEDRGLFGRVTGMGQNKLQGFLQDLMSSESATESFDQSRRSLTEEAQPFTKLAHKSLTKIIPDLLSEILREAEMIRTGSDQVERRQYSHDTGRLERESDVQRNMAERILPSEEIETVHERIQKLIDTIDPEGVLTESQRHALQGQLVTDMATGRGFNVERLLTNRGLSTVDSDEDRSAIQQTVRNRFMDENDSFRTKDDEAVRARKVGSSLYRRGRQSLPNHQETIRQYREIYGDDALRQMGLLTTEESDSGIQSRTADDAIFQRLSGDSDNEAFVSASKASGNVRPLEPGRSVDDEEESVEPTAGQMPIDTRSLETAVRSIDPSSRLDTANDWLERIHRALDGGGNTPPPSGPSTPNSPGSSSDKTSWRDRAAGWSKSAQSRIRQGYGQVRDRVSEAGERMPSMESLGEQWSKVPDAQAVGESFTRGASTVSEGFSSASRVAQGRVANFFSGDGPAEQSVEQANNDDRYNGGWKDTVADRWRSIGQRARQGAESVEEQAQTVLGRLSSFIRREKDEEEGATTASETDNLQRKEELSQQGVDTTLLERLHQQRTDHLNQRFDDVIAAIGTGGSGESGGSGLLSKLTSGAGSMGSGLMSYYGKMFQGMGSLISGGGKGIGGFAQQGLTGLGKKLFNRGDKGGGEQSQQKLGDTTQSYLDIYRQDDPEPVIYARDLRLQKYFDAESGEPITALADIEGPVVDESGNYVITQEDIDEDRLYVLDPESGDTQSATSTVLQGAKAAGGKALGMLGSYYKGVGSIATTVLSKVWETAKGVMSGPRDVYVKGEQQPRLLAVGMKRGYYFDADTQEPISSIDDIEGPVVDREGNYLISEEDLKTGLIDSKGESLEGAKDFISSATGAAMKGLGAYYKGVWNVGKKAVQGLGSMVGSLLPGGGGKGEEPGGGMSADLTTLETHAQRQSDLLDKIYAMLDKRLPQPEKDTREGSWKDLMGDEAGAGATGDGDGRSSDYGPDSKNSLLNSLPGLGGIGSMLGDAASGAADMGRGVRDRFRNRGKNVAEEDGRNRNRGRGRGGRGGGRGGRIKGGGKWGKLARGAVSVGARALPFLGMAASGLASAGSAIAAGAGSLLAGAAAVISSPVVLTVGAVAAVAIGGYLAYKYFSSGSIGPIGKVRLAQYGFSMEQEKAAKKTAAVEDFFSDKVSISEGKGNVEEFEMDDLLEKVEISKNDEEAVKKFTNWVRNRFLPVYMNHRALAQQRHDIEDLTELDGELSKEEKIRFINDMKFPDGDNSPYRVTQSPFESVGQLMSRDGVNNVIEKQIEEIRTGDSEEDEGSPDESSDAKPSDSQTQRGRAGAAAPDTGDSSTSSNKDATESTSTDTQKVTTPSDSSSKSDQQATTPSDSTSGPQPDTQTKRIEEAQRREAQRAQQTERQAEQNTRSNLQSMNRMVSILQDSYRVQSSMDRSLKEIQQTLNARLGTEDTSKETSQTEQTSQTTSQASSPPSGNNPSTKPPVSMQR